MLREAQLPGSFAPGARLRPVSDGGGMEGGAPTACGGDGDAGVHPCRHQCAGAIDNDPGEVSIESPVAWSGARLSTPCTQFAVNFELATEAINGEFVKGRKRFDAYALANTCRIHMGRDSDGPGIPVETSEIALNHFTIGLGNLNARVRIERP